MRLNARFRGSSPKRILAATAAILWTASAHAEVTFLPVVSEFSFPDATAPDAIQYACAQTSSELERYFEQKRLRFLSALLAPRGEYPACHIYYEPTVPGYRALPDNRPVQGLYVAVDPMSFIVARKPVGDSLSIAKQILPQLGRPVDVTISVAGNFDRALWPGALKFHFGESKHRFQVRQSGAISSHPWAQDHQKAGEVDGRLRILVPRRLYEGRREDGAVFGPMLDKLNDPGFARSKLAWEGGDIQFVRDPKTPSRLILVHGGVGRYYWGTGLTPEETQYVLMTEFGADAAIDLTAASVHADFVAAFLPADGVALVSQSVGDDPRLFRAAASILDRLCGAQPPPALLDLQRFLSTWNDDLAGSAGAIRGLLRGLEKAFASYAYPEDPVIEAQLTEYVAAHCGGNPETCFQGDAKNRMHALVPDLLRRSTEQSADIGLFDIAAPRILAIMEAQLPRPAAPREVALEEAARAFEAAGFRVVRVPYVYSPKLHDSWPGVSYANSFIDGRKIFMPAIGLGPLETAMFADMQERVGPGYQIIPVNAWSAVLNNGGAHCVFGIVREPEPARILSE